jgi:predicted ATPase/DNA-binding NarL/FixJ family response regulator
MSVLPQIRHNLPTQPTSFIGREDEIAEITVLLADPACRLLTLTGPGGSGKTRLAIEVAQQLELADGTFFVPLQSLSSIEHIVTSIVDVLPLQLHGQADPQQQLLSYLRDRHMLLILDNFEHLLDGASLVTGILDTAPGIKLLVTSREALNLQAEHLWPLAGLDLPPDDLLDGFERYSAVWLFAERTRRVKPDFSPAAHRHEIVRICRLVDGLPLALELAASWTRALSLQAIGDEIERGIDFLATNQRDLPQRHRSMQAVFDHSWRLLSEEERAVFPRLSVFRGGFTSEAAEQVAGASLPLLASLIDKSLLRLDPSGRYDLHELLCQYARQQLNPEEQQAVAASHSTCYLTRLAQAELTIRAGNRETILLDIDNIREAWIYAVEQGNWKLVQSAIYALFWLYWLQSWFAEGRTMFRLPVGRLDAGFDEQRLLLGALLILWGSYMRFDQHKEVIANIRRGLTFLERFDSRPEMCTPLVHAAPNLLRAGADYGYVERIARRALTVCRRHSEDWGLGHSLSLLGYLCVARGEIGAGRMHLEEAVHVNRQTGDAVGLGWSFQGLSEAAGWQGQYLDAVRYFEQAIQHHRTINYQTYIPTFLYRLAEIALDQGDDVAASEYLAQQFAISCEIFPYARTYTRCFYKLMQAIVAAYQGNWLLAETTLERGFAEHYGEEFRFRAGFLALMCGRYKGALHLLKEGAAYWSARGNYLLVMRSKCYVGYALLGLGQYDAAAEYLDGVLKASLDVQAWPYVLQALTGIAQLPDVPAALAVQVLVLTGSHPAANRFSHMEANRTLTDLEAKLSQETFQTAVKLGESLDLETAVQLLAAFQPDGEVDAAGIPAPPRARATNQALPKPLTPRELEILVLICRGLSNQQIADRLVVGVSTVKKHINGLYGKLAVASRSQAILRAQELELV